MKKIFLGFLLIGVVMIFASLANASCVTNHAIQHGNLGVQNLAAAPCASCIPRFWCLSTGTINNQGTNVAWWQYDAPTTSWWYNGSWQNPGINGCCGMWDAVGGDSRTMMATVEAYVNEGAATHYGIYETETMEKLTAGGTDYFFTRAAYWNFREIPYFRIAAGFANGPIGGTSSFSLMGWGTIASGTGPAQYWARLMNGTVGANLTLGSSCTPGGTNACPAPIQGYQIRARFDGCVGGVCPAPIRPVSSLIANWPTAAGGGGVINTRTPGFPVGGVTVANPGTNTTANCYLWIATQLRYADGFVSNYTSRNNSAGVKWLLTGLGAEIDALAAKYSTPSDVRVNWLSVVEGTSFGYNVYRSFSPTGTFTKVNAKVIPVLGDGSSYAYKDRVISPTPRNVYYKVGIVRDIATGKDDIQQNLAVAKAQPK